MRTFDSDKQRILDRVSLVDVVSQHVTLRRVGRRMVGLCPFHAEKSPSFSVNPDLGLFKCFGCGKGGDLFTFVQLRENVPFVDALQILADRAGIELHRTGAPAPGEISRADLARVNTWAADYFHRALVAGPAETRKYLADRGAAWSFAQQFGLGFALGADGALRSAAAQAGISAAMLKEADLIREDEHGRSYDTFRNRIMFPIRDATGRIIGFGGRTLGDDRAKYLNTRQTQLFDKSRVLFGLDLGREAMQNRRRAVLVEGYFDCLAAHQGGFSETVATLGTALTEFHIDLLRRYTEEAVILFDSDSAGEAAAERAIAVALPRCLRVRLARIPDGKDPSDFFQNGTAEGFSDILNSAVDALEFKWSATLGRFHGEKSDAARREAIQDFLQVVAAACAGGGMDVIQRGLMVNQVAHVLHLDRSEVDRLLGQIRGKNGPAPAGSRMAPPRDVMTRHADGEQAAWEMFLEATLAEPAAMVGDDWPDLLRITDPLNFEIANVCRELSGTLGDFSLADVLVRLEGDDLTRRASELAERGLARGNVEATMAAALEKLRGAHRTRDMDQSKDRLRQGGEGTDERKELANIHHGLRERRGFAPRRLVVPPPSDVSPQPVVKPS